jgi:hypothetical protein
MFASVDFDLIAGSVPPSSGGSPDHHRQLAKILIYGAFQYLFRNDTAMVPL